MATTRGPQILAEKASRTQPDSLPGGWSAFHSEAERGEESSRWYATAPWLVANLIEKYKINPRTPGNKLVQTVEAVTWDELIKKVQIQVTLHSEVTGTG